LLEELNEDEELPGSLLEDSMDFSESTEEDDSTSSAEVELESPQATKAKEETSRRIGMSLFMKYAFFLPKYKYVLEEEGLSSC
jgi:hypothetical protein